MTCRRILVICSDVVGQKMAGPAIRCVEIEKALSAHFEVKLCAPKVDNELALPFEFYSCSHSRFADDVNNFDVIIFQGNALFAYPSLKKTKAILIADLYCPVPLEYHQASSAVELAIRGETGLFLSDIVYEQLAFADHFLCASERQREFWLGALTVAGRINALRWPEARHAAVSDLISILPFGLPEQKPIKARAALRSRFAIPPDDFVLVWGGGIYQWFDPLTPIRAIHKLVLGGARVHLVFIGVKHPNPGVEKHDMCAEAITLATDLGLIDKFVHFNFGWVDYGDRQNYLLDANVGISAHFDNPETRYSFRTRMLDYLWCGLPIISTRGDVFGDALEGAQIGLSVDYEDEEGWLRAIDSMMKDSNKVLEFHKATMLYAERYQWSRIVQPLVNLFSIISSAEDRVIVRRHYARSNDISGLKGRLQRAYSTGGIKHVLSSVLRKVWRFFRRVLGLH